MKSPSAKVAMIGILMLGLTGAIAAREGRLLALSTVMTLLKGRMKEVARFAGGAVAVAVTSMLACASLTFVRHTQESGNIVAYGVPRWLPQSVLPLGFAIVAWRLIRHSSDTWRGRAVADFAALLIKL